MHTNIKPASSPTLGLLDREKRLYTGDAPPPAVRPTTPSSPRRHSSGLVGAQISSSLLSCNPEPDQVPFELLSTIRHLFFALHSAIEEAIKAARFRAALLIRPPFSLDYKRKSNPSRFQSPCCHRSRNPSRCISAQADSGEAVNFQRRPAIPRLKANSHLRQPAAKSMGKPSVKGLSAPNQWATIAMLGEDESALKLDWLSNLPDDVLLNIIDRLDVADAMRTSILSRRWKLIPTMLSKILIMVGSTDNVQQRTCAAAWANATVLGATRSLLESRITSPYTIHRLCMQFFLGDGSINIGQTVAKTMATHKVGFVEFTILTEKEGTRCSSDERIFYGKQLKLFIVTCPYAFSCLARLNLENLMLRETDFPKIFRLCKRLEFLRLDNCDMGFRSLLTVEHPRLCELEIVRCNFERVDLNWLPELTTLTLVSWMSLDDPLSFGYVPLLHTVSISNMARSWHKMLELSEFLGKATISNLHLGFQSEKIWVKPQDPKELSQVFSELRLLNLAAISEECDLRWTLFVLQGAPSLEELCIRVCDCLQVRDEEERKKHEFSEERKDAGAKWEASDFKHHKLSVLRIFGFQSKLKFLDYITTVMEAAVNLKDIYLHEKPACEEKCAYIRQRGDKFPKSGRQKILVRNSLDMHMRPLLRLHFRFKK